MTDAELVEAVAREVLKVHIQTYSDGTVMIDEKDKIREFHPFSDMNDLQMVKDKFESWIIIKDGDTGIHKATVIVGDKATRMICNSEWRAVCEAALTAEREKE